MATNLAIDQELLDRALAVGGEKTKKATVNLALLGPIPLQLLHLALAVAAFGLWSVVGWLTLGSPSPAPAQSVPWQLNKVQPS